MVAPDFPYVYSWGNNNKRALLKGRPCRILAEGAMRSVMVEFADGQREIVSRRALKKGEQLCLFEQNSGISQV